MHGSHVIVIVIVIEILIVLACSVSRACLDGLHGEAGIGRDTLARACGLCLLDVSMFLHMRLRVCLCVCDWVVSV